MTVGVASTHSITRKALCALLASVPQVNKVLEVANPLEHVESLRKIHDGTLLFDAANPAVDLETVARTRKLVPEVKILLLAPGVDEELELRTIKAGAQGCISREADPQFLTKALAAVDRGEVWVSQRVASRIIEEFVRSRDKSDKGLKSSELSSREWEILALVAQGLRNKRIADQLCVCESTIKTHLYSIFQKLAISSRLEATLYYYHHLKRDGASASPAPMTPLSAPPPQRHPSRPAGRAPFATS